MNPISKRQVLTVHPATVAVLLLVVCSCSKPIPEPVSEFSLFLDQHAKEFDHKRVEAIDQLDKTHPILVAGDAHEFQLTTKMLVSGELTEVKKNSLTLQTSTRIRDVDFSDLLFFDRLRVDTQLREEFTTIVAALQSYDLTRESYHVPELHLEDKLSPEDLVYLGHPEFVVEAGKSFIREQDYSRALAYLFPLSRLNSEASYLVGRLMVEGWGLPLDIARGEAFIQQAAEVGSPLADAYFESKYAPSASLSSEDARKERFRSEMGSSSPSVHKIRKHPLRRELSPITIEQNLRDRPVRLIGKEYSGHKLYRENTGRIFYEAAQGHRVYVSQSFDN